ncbi:MAG: SDR family oxidoreductase [Nitrospirae bacterium]|nr:SDR family oxidoreductase [Nitrospirota bacterium]
MRLERKIAIVTGGGTGIGEAIAKVFAREGAKVAITGRRKGELERVVGDIERKGGQALALPGSVTDEQDVQEAVAATVRRFGRLDILVNNAGNLFHTAPLHETTDQIWDETFDVFMKGTFRFIRAAIPRMLQQGGGSILNISTIAGLKAMPGFEAHAYPAAKAGVIMLTKTVAVHYAKQNIRCNCICPAGVLTPPVTDMLKDPQAKAWFESMHPMGRLGQPEEVAEATVYFASDESRWTTGSILSVDGGVMAA